MLGWSGASKIWRPIKYVFSDRQPRQNVRIFRRFRVTLKRRRVFTPWRGCLSQNTLLNFYHHESCNTCDTAHCCRVLVRNIFAGKVCNCFEALEKVPAGRHIFTNQHWFKHNQFFLTALPWSERVREERCARLFPTLGARKFADCIRPILGILSVLFRGSDMFDKKWAHAVRFWADLLGFFSWPLHSTLHWGPRQIRGTWYPGHDGGRRVKLRSHVI